MATTRIDQVFHNPNELGRRRAPTSSPSRRAPPSPSSRCSSTASRSRPSCSTPTRRAASTTRSSATCAIPALLEYIGQGAIQASVFPIPPGEDRADPDRVRRGPDGRGRAVRYLYPLNTERFSAQPLEQVSVRVAVESAEPIRADLLAVPRRRHRPPGRLPLRRRLRGQRRPADTDFELFYTVSPDPIGANLLSYRRSRDRRGLLHAPGRAGHRRRSTEHRRQGRDHRPRHLRQHGGREDRPGARRRSSTSSSHLNPEDRFNVVEFSTGAREYARGLVARPAKPTDAARWVERLPATGGTDINLALLDAMAMVESERPTMRPLPDRRPADRGRDRDRPHPRQRRRRRARKTSASSPSASATTSTPSCSTRWSSEHHGATTYVRPGERLDEAVSRFYAGVSAPVLADVELDFGGVHVEEIYPTPLPDLFAGTQLVVLGQLPRRRPGDDHAQRRGQRRAAEFTYQDQTFATGGRRRLPAAPLGDPQDRLPAQPDPPPRREPGAGRGDRRSQRPLRDRHALHLLPDHRGRHPDRGGARPGRRRRRRRGSPPRLRPARKR